MRDIFPLVPLPGASSRIYISIILNSIIVLSNRNGYFPFLKLIIHLNIVLHHKLFTYAQCLQMDLGLMPFKAQGPVWTPPNKDHDVPDGEYTNISRKWE
jgi:hypothetical protein